MKKLIFILALSLVFAGCKKDEPKPKLLDPNAMLLIKEAKMSVPKAVKSIQQAPGEQQLPTWEWVVRNATGMFFKNTEFQMPMGYFTRTIQDGQRDLEKMAIKMFGTDIIGRTSYGTTPLETEFIGASDCIFLYKNDTVAYIPNDTLRAARVKVEAAYNAGNYEEVYRLFDKAFVARPTTGKIWRELKSQGKN